MKQKVWILALFLIVLTFSVSAQDRERIEAAKKEGGKVVVYGSLDNDTIDLIAGPLKKQIGIEIDFWRGSSTKVMDRALGELRSGKPLFDVILTTSAAMQLLLREGALVTYDSPSAKAFPRTVMHPLLGPQYRNSIIGIVYHAGMIKGADAPRAIEDLLKPQFGDKLVMPDPSQHTTTANWLASIHKVIGDKARADRFVRSLAAAKPLLVESLTPAAERIASGERPIGITHLTYVTIYRKQGTPLDYARLGKFMGDGQAAAIGANAPHPNAAKAFIDFFLGEESLRLMAGIGEFVTRKGIYPPLADADKIQLVDMVEMDKHGFGKKMAEYRKIFLPR